MSTHRKNLRSPWLYTAICTTLLALTLAILSFAGVVPFWGGLVAVPVAFLAFKVWDKETDDSNDTWGAGARAERQVGEELDRLHAVGFHVFHDLHFGSEGERNIDHLLIGREGVFAIETKSWQGVITSKVSERGENRGKAELCRNGRWLRYCNLLSQAKWGAAKASEMICTASKTKPYVTPVVCFSRADVRLYGKVEGVEVSELGALKRVILQGRGKRYTEDEAREMAETIEERIGLSPAAAPGTPPEEPSQSRRFFEWFFDLPSLYLSLGLVFLLSLLFPGQFSEILGAFSGLYGVLSDLYGYFIFRQ